MKRYEARQKAFQISTEQSFPEQTFKTIENPQTNKLSVNIDVLLPESHQIRVVPEQNPTQVPQFKHNQNLLRKNKEAKSIRLLKHMVNSRERTNSNPLNHNPNHPSYSCITQEKGTQFSSNIS